MGLADVRDFRAFIPPFCSERILVPLRDSLRP